MEKLFFGDLLCFHKEKSFSFFSSHDNTANRVFFLQKRKPVYIYLLHGIEGLGGRKRKEFSSTFLRSRNTRILYSPDTKIGS